MMTPGQPRSKSGRRARRSGARGPGGARGRAPAPPARPGTGKGPPSLHRRPGTRVHPLHRPDHTPVRLARKLIVAILLALVLVLSVLGYLRVRRELAVFDADMRRDHAVVARSLHAALVT